MKKESAPIQFGVPMKPYLYRFLCYIEGLKEDEALDLNRKSLTTDTLKRLLKYKKHCRPTKLKAGYNSVLKVIIPQSIWNQGWFYLDNMAIYDFNMAIYFFFHEILELRIMEGVANGKTRTDVIDGFIALLDIHEEVDFETLKKANFRLRRPRHNRIVPRNKYKDSTNNRSLMAQAQ